MEFSFQIKKYHLKVFSSISSNFAVVFLAANFVTTDRLLLIFNFVSAILFLWLAIRSEKELELYDQF